MKEFTVPVHSSNETILFKKIISLGLGRFILIMENYVYICRWTYRTYEKKMQIFVHATTGYMIYVSASFKETGIAEM